MGTLTFTLCDEVTGTLTGQELDDIDISAELTVDGDCIGSVDWTHTPEILDEVTIQAEAEFEVEPADLHGSHYDRHAFALEMLQSAFATARRLADQKATRTTQAEATAKNTGNELSAARSSLRAAEMKLAAVWPAVTEALDFDPGPSVARARVLDALRTLGLEPESKTGTES